MQKATPKGGLITGLWYTVTMNESTVRHYPFNASRIVLEVYPFWNGRRRLRAGVKFTRPDIGPAVITRISYPDSTRMLYLVEFKDATGQLYRDIIFWIQVKKRFSEPDPRPAWETW